MEWTARRHGSVTDWDDRSVRRRSGLLPQRSDSLAEYGEHVLNGGQVMVEQPDEQCEDEQSDERIGERM